MKETTIQNERDRADKEERINESLGILVSDREFAPALYKIMRLWCEALHAQWCYAGRWLHDSYHTVQSYAAPGEELLYDPDTRVEYVRSLNDNNDFHGANDYVAMPDFRESPVFEDFVRVSPRPDAVRQVSSCFSHVIRHNGRAWGTLVLLFRDRHELTENEERFFKASVRGIELALMRQEYEQEINADHTRTLAAEQDRADKERRINASLEVLVAETDMAEAYRKIMSMWSESLGAQWCILGRREGDDLVVESCHAAPGSKPIAVDGAVIRRAGAFDERCRACFGSDFYSMPIDTGGPVADAFEKISPNPEAVRDVSNGYCHIIRHRGREWGSLVMLFRTPRTFTPNEEAFFKASAKGIELGLERKAAEDAIKAERDRALAAEKARSLFFSSVSHDIRTPLNAIIGFAELLKAGVADAEEREKYIATIESSGKMLARLVNDLLDLSKLESGRMEILNEPTDIAAVVREVIDAFGVVRARKSILFRADLAEMPRVSVDPQRIRQLLYNLLSNAYKYTDSGSIRLSTKWNAGTFLLSVADTGKGIAKDDIDRILQPFVQLADRNHRNGTGLGLSICQKLSQLMGGELRIESEVGKGSTFTVELRNVEVVRDAAAPTERHAVRATVSGGFRRKDRVLVVDDSPVNRAILRAMLVKNGVTDVVMAENGTDAMAKLRDDAAIRAVLTDLWMPEMDGEGLCRAIRGDDALKHLPVYLVTADVEALKTYGGDLFSGILLKPITNRSVAALLTDA